ncbi:hypothetical protein BH23ACT11_BH23ACT11_12770 [soil metagenome]
MWSRMSSSPNGSPGAEQQGIHPRYRRAFGCVTWIYMATLAFLAVASLGLMPVWFIAGWDLFSILEGVVFYAILVFLPALVLAAVVGSRTYRIERQPATRNGTAVGSVFGVTGFIFPVWLENVTAGIGIYWLAVPPLVLAGCFLLYAVLPVELDYPQRRRLVVISAIIAGVTGLLLLILNFSVLQLFVAVVATLAGAAGGWTAGVGYARAGGEEMLPPAAGRVR